MRLASCNVYFSPFCFTDKTHISLPEFLSSVNLIPTLQKYLSIWLAFFGVSSFTSQFRTRVLREPFWTIRSYTIQKLSSDWAVKTNRFLYQLCTYASRHQQYLPRYTSTRPPFRSSRSLYKQCVKLNWDYCCFSANCEFWRSERSSAMSSLLWQYDYHLFT